MSMLGHNNPPRGLVEWGENHILASPRLAVRKALERGYLRHKLKWLRRLESNNLIAACCQNPTDNADLEAWYSRPREKVPDIYKFHCRECERAHVFFCVGGNHPLSRQFIPQSRPDLYEFRPKWEVR